MSVLFVDASSVAGYSPANHSATVNRRLVDASSGAAQLELLVGASAGNASAHEHYHPGIEQMCYVLEGVAKVSAAGQQRLMTAGSACYFPAGRSHRVEQLADSGPLRMLVAYSPPYLERKAAGIPGPDPLTKPEDGGETVPWGKPLFTATDEDAAERSPLAPALSPEHPSCASRALVDTDRMDAQSLSLFEVTLAPNLQADFDADAHERAIYVLSGEMDASIAGQSGRLRMDSAAFLVPNQRVRLNVSGAGARILVFRATTGH